MGPGRWRCNTCRREAWSSQALARLRKGICCGHVASKCHQSHCLSTTCGVLWCRSCGAYTTRQPRTLRFLCAGRPRSEAAYNVRARLAKGLPPTAAAYLKTATIDDNGPYSNLRGAHADERHSDACTFPELALPPAAAHPPEGPPHAPQTNAGDPVGGNVRRRIRGKSAPPAAVGATTLTSVTQTEAASTRNGASDGAIINARAQKSTNIKGPRYRQLDLRGSYELEDSAATTEAPSEKRVTWPPPAARPVPRAARDTFCSPAAETAWTQRIAINGTAMMLPCGICASKCRGRCNGCGANCCVACARARRACAPQSQAASGHDDQHLSRRQQHPRHHHHVGRSLGLANGAGAPCSAGLTHPSSLLLPSSSPVSSLSADRIRHRQPVVLGDDALRAPSVPCLSPRAALDRQIGRNDDDVDDLNGTDASMSHSLPSSSGDWLASPPTTSHASAPAAVASCSVVTASEVPAAAPAACAVVGGSDLM